MKSVSGGTFDYLTYEFAVPATQPLTVSCQFQPSSYAPGSGAAGYVSPGWFYVTREGSTACEGNVIFDMGKPYSAAFDPAYTMVLLGDVGRDTVRQGAYIPGELYTTTMEWHRDTSTIDITVAWSGGQYTKTVSSSGAAVTGLTYSGPNIAAMGTSSFGNVVVTTPEPATMALLSLGVSGFLVRRRQAGK
jgi:hypothetical protein